MADFPVEIPGKAESVGYAEGFALLNLKSTRRGNPLLFVSPCFNAQREPGLDI
jgi:hypothetical protein